MHWPLMCFSGRFLKIPGILCDDEIQTVMDIKHIIWFNNANEKDDAWPLVSAHFFHVSQLIQITKGKGKLTMIRKANNKMRNKI